MKAITQSNIFTFGVHLLPLFLLQLKSQYSVCDIIVGDGDDMLLLRGVFTPGGDLGAAAAKLCREQRAYLTVHISGLEERREGKMPKNPREKKRNTRAGLLRLRKFAGGHGC